MQNQKVTYTSVAFAVTAVFTAWLAAVSFFSRDSHMSFIVAGIWCWCLVVAWLSFRAQKKSLRWIDVFANFLIILALIASCMSIYAFFSQPDALSYPRMRGFFDTHNVYAAFLIFPMLAAWRYTIKYAGEHGVKPWAYGAATSLLVSQFILTFSRGMWLATAGALVIFVVLHRKSGGVKLLMDKHKLRKAAGSVLIAGVLVSLGVYWGAVLLIPASSFPKAAVFSPYASETVVENGVTARVHYMKDGLVLARNNLLTGVGPGMYDEALRQSKKDFEFYSAHSHNSLINLLAEAGIMGLILGLIVLLYVVRICVLVLKKYADNGLMGIAAFSVLAILMHSLVDADFEYSMVVFILSAFVGILRAFTEVSARREFKSNFVRYAALVGIGVLVLVTLSQMVATLYLKQARVALLAQPVEAIRLAELSAQFSPLNASQDVIIVEALMNIMPKATSSDIAGIGEDALTVLQRVHVKRECSSRAYYDEFIVLNILERIEDSTQSLRASIDCAPTASHDQLLMLVRLLDARRDYYGAMKVIDEFLPRYERFAKTAWFGTYPYKDKVASTINSLRSSRASLCQAHAELRECGE